MQSVLGRSALREPIKSAGWSTRPGTGDCSGDSEKVNGMTSDIPMVKKAQPSGERRLRVRFAGDRRQYVLDLTGLIARSRHFANIDLGRMCRRPPSVARGAAADSAGVGGSSGSGSGSDS